MTWALLRGDVGGPCAAGVLQVGNGYGVQNVQDFYRDPGGRGNIPLPMVGRHPPKALIGRAYHAGPVTGPTFNVLVVMKTP